MKVLIPDFAPNPLRRKLLLGVPGSLALASPLALIACGGSDDSTPAGSGGNGTQTDPPGPVTSSTATVNVDLPAALAASAGALQIVTATGTAPVSGGSATVTVLGDKPQLVSVVGADGYVRLLGWAGAGQPPVSSVSTAAVLLHFGLGAPFLGPDARDELRTRLLAQPAVAAFGSRIVAELQADPKALSAMKAGIGAGFDDAANTLLPPGAAAAGTKQRPAGLVIEPATDQSGLQVVQGETLNSFFVDNVYVRRAVVIVNREAWVDSSGAEQLEANAPVQVGEVQTLPLPAAVDSIANVVGGWANEYYQPDDPNGFFRSVSETQTLEITPSDAKRTRYSIVVLAAGALPPADPAAFARLPADQQAYVNAIDLDKNLILQTLLWDLVAPFFFEMLSSSIARVDKHAEGSVARADAELLKAFAAQIFATLQSRMPDVIQQVSAGSLDLWGAFKIIMKACTFDPDTGEVSPLLQEFLVTGATLLAKSLADVGLRSRVLEIATGVSFGNKNVLGLIPALKIMSVFDSVLGKAALLRIVADAGRSSRMVSWSVVATKAKVVLKPDPLEVPADAATYPITAEIVDNDNDEYGNEKGSISFDWTCTGQYGTLYSPVDAGLANPNTFTTSATNAKPNYLPNGVKFDPANPDKVTVRAYFEPIGSGGTRALIGTASAPITFKQEFSVKISPPGPTDLPTDLTFPVAAFLEQKVPDGASVEWTWTHGGVGTITALPVDTNTHDYSAQFATGSSDGSATLTVSAKVSVPASGGKPSRTVVTDPVTATFNVKKGTREITFDAPGGVFVCGPTCGVSDYTAYIVPRIPGALGYRAVFSGFGYGPCNRSVSWNSQIPDGGGCSFPITYHPFAAGEAASAWAVWIGFGGPIGEGKCTVTITLPA